MSCDIEDGKANVSVGCQHAFRLALPHTFVKDFEFRYTCINNGRSEPKQMDYMATTAPMRWITEATVAELDATKSDHWPLSFVLEREQVVKEAPRREEKRRSRGSP